MSRYWEPIYHDDTNEIILDPDEFYILARRRSDNTRQPAAEMVPFFRLSVNFAHYGVFRPGFGMNEAVAPEVAQFLKCDREGLLCRSIAGLSGA